IDVVAAIARAEASGAAGKVVTIPVTGVDSGPHVVHLIGIGSGSTDDLRRVGAALGRAVRGKERVATTLASTADDAGLKAFVEGAILATFAMSSYKGADLPDSATPAATVVLAGEERDDLVAEARTVAGATWLARELIHTPANDKDPA